MITRLFFFPETRQLSRRMASVAQKLLWEAALDGNQEKFEVTAFNACASPLDSTAACVEVLKFALCFYRLTRFSQCVSLSHELNILQAALSSGARIDEPDEDKVPSFRSCSCIIASCKSKILLCGLRHSRLCATVSYSVTAALLSSHCPLTPYQ